MKEGRLHPLADLVGTLPDEDAREMLQVIAEEFERIDADDHIAELEELEDVPS